MANEKLMHFPVRNSANNRKALDIPEMKHSGPTHRARTL